LSRTRERKRANLSAMHAPPLSYQYSTPLSPLDANAARTRRALLTSGVVTICGLTWALWPTAQRLPQPVDPSHILPTTGIDVAPLNSLAFDAPLWHTPSAPVIAVTPPPLPPPPPPPPPLPLRLQLIGIITLANIPSGNDNAMVFRAAIYDPDADTTVFASVGDTIAGRQVTSIDGAGVTLSRGALTQSLILDQLQLGLSTPLPAAKSKTDIKRNNESEK